MIVDCHGHYTTAPKQLEERRKRQIAALEDAKHAPSKGTLGISDDEIRASLEGAQLKQKRERCTDVTIFPPSAMGMSHHICIETTSCHWFKHCNYIMHLNDVDFREDLADTQFNHRVGEGDRPLPRGQKRRPGNEYEPPQVEGSVEEQRFVKHLRVQPQGTRRAEKNNARREHPLRVRD